MPAQVSYTTCMIYIITEPWFSPSFYWAWLRNRTSINRMRWFTFWTPCSVRLHLLGAHEAQQVPVVPPLLPVPNAVRWITRAGRCSKSNLSRLKCIRYILSEPPFFTYWPCGCAWFFFLAFFISTPLPTWAGKKLHMNFCIIHAKKDHCWTCYNWWWRVWLREREEGSQMASPQCTEQRPTTAAARVKCCCHHDLCALIMNSSALEE